jgi:cytosine/adenosine deaminase-related metal-dependent hydrolase
VAFVGVSVLNPDDQAPGPDRTVLVHEGRITAVGPRDSVAVPAGTLVVNGAGRLLMPGLVDMHVHTLERSAHMLLELANGVTSVREMDGFPWLLRQRAQVRAGKLLAPTLYVAGTILNASPMDYYATVVRTPEEARAAVRAQKAAGYDFIKVHNVMPKAVYQAIGQEAAAVDTAHGGHIRTTSAWPRPWPPASARTEHFRATCWTAT